MWSKQEESKPVSSSSGAAPVAARLPEAQAPTAVRTIAGVTAEVVSAAGGVLTSSIRIKGEIRGTEDLYVDGEVRGMMQLGGGRVTVGPHGKVFGDIDAREIVVRGQVQGALRARERVEIARTGELHGEITTSRISIEEGAQIRGKTEVLRGKDSTNRAPEKLAAAAQPLVS